jgi:spore coat protein U-like protein
MFTHSMKLAATVVLLSSLNMATALADSCHVSTGAVAFGAYDTASAGNLDAVGTLDIHCSNKVHVKLSLSVVRMNCGGRFVFGGATVLLI